MKKIYLIPTITVVKVESSKMIAASLNDVLDTGGTATLTDEFAEDGVGGMARRRDTWGNIWDDEEDEEEDE